MKKLVFLIYLVICASMFRAQAPAAGLLGQWPFCGNANDVSGNNNHGVVTGASLTTDRFGASNAAYSFNGTSNYITMPNGGPTGSGSRSLSFWIKTTNTSMQTAFGYGVSNAGGGLYQVLFNHSCSGVGFDCSSTATMWDNPSLTDNNWHHIVAVLDASAGVQINDIKLYVDAVLQTVMNCGGSPNTTINTLSSLPIQIGKDPNAMSRYFNGKLDDFYFYDKALSQQEITALFQLTAAAPAAPAAIFGNSVICPGTTNIYSVAPVAGASYYTWTLPGGWSGTSTSNTISVLSGAGSGSISVSVTGSCATSPVNKLFVSTGCEGVEKQAASGLPCHVYPNPGDGRFIVRIYNEAVMQVYDYKGALVDERHLARGENVLDLSNQIEGIYFLRLSSGTEHASQKIVKK